jgi:hypothetical protein
MPAGLGTGLKGMPFFSTKSAGDAYLSLTRPSLGFSALALIGPRGQLVATSPQPYESLHTAGLGVIRSRRYTTREWGGMSMSATTWGEA